MKTIFWAIVVGVILQAIESTHAATVIPCDATQTDYICGQHNPEDLIRLPGTSWIVSTSLNIDFGHALRVRGTGPLTAIDLHTHAQHLLYPSPDSTIDWDQKLYPDCALPPQPFTSHGIDAQHLADGKFRLYVANHGERESVEIVDVTVLKGTLHASWRGCVKVPTELQIWPNAVAPLPGGGFVLSGNNLALWRPGIGWTRVDGFHGLPPGSPSKPDLGFANGVEVSRDGRWIFVADTFHKTVSRFAVNVAQAPQVLELDFSPGYFWPDNLHWGEDGMLYLAGPYSVNKDLPDDCYTRIVCDEIGIGVAQIDPVRFTARVIYRSSGIPGRFGAATTALQIDAHFWIGASVADRIAIIRPPR